MSKAILGAGWLVLAWGAAFGQAPEAQPSFEVASIKPGAPRVSNLMRASGGPGTSDPERFTYTNVTLKALVLRGYGVKNYQVSGPAWLDSERFDILAKVPPGSTKQQLNGMLRNLLAERFHLILHHETKDLAVYELVVGKDGPKLKASDLDALPPAREPGAPALLVGVPDNNGIPQVPPGLAIMIGRMADGIMHWTGRMQSLSDLAAFLEGELARPVLDKTGLTGKYDFNLAYSRDGLRQIGPPGDPTASQAESPSGGLNLLGAVQQQLGLKLESARAAIDILILDLIDKTPTEN